MDSSSISYYDLLGVAADASAGEIRSAYRTAARAAHPERGGNPQGFIALTHAYDVLSKPAERLVYDGSLAGEPVPPDTDRKANISQLPFARTCSGTGPSARPTGEVCGSGGPGRRGQAGYCSWVLVSDFC